MVSLACLLRVNPECPWHWCSSIRGFLLLCLFYADAATTIGARSCLAPDRSISI